MGRFCILNFTPFSPNSLLKMKYCSVKDCNSRSQRSLIPTESRRCSPPDKKGHEEFTIITLYTVNPAKGSANAYIVSHSSLLPVGEMMPNKCNPRIKSINPDQVQRGIETGVWLQPSHIGGRYQDSPVYKAV